MTPVEFRAWEERHGLTLAGTATALGLSARSIGTYRRDGAPQHVAMACYAYERHWLSHAGSWLATLGAEAAS